MSASFSMLAVHLPAGSGAICTGSGKLTIVSCYTIIKKCIRKYLAGIERTGRHSSWRDPKNV